MKIYFGKPYADYYIDDLAINCFEDIEKDVGYYMDKIEPRYFNKIENNSIEIYRKSSKNLDGEIYYYKNIPKIIKKNFPLLIDHDENNTWYSMEKVNGLSVSTLYISELLTIKNLKDIMDAIKKYPKYRNKWGKNIIYMIIICEKLKNGIKSMIITNLKIVKSNTIKLEDF